MSADPTTLTRISPDLYCWPSGRSAIMRCARVWIAYTDTPTNPSVKDTRDNVRVFDTPTLAASALGARLPDTPTPPPTE